MLIVLAKAPVPGRVKTRLCPPATPQQAADLAAAALADTLAAARRVSTARVVVALDGEPDAALAAALKGTTVIGQRGGPLGERIAAAHADVVRLMPGACTVQIGMDTPQLDPDVLGGCLDAVSRPDGPDALLGPATDGGWWALALRDPRRAQLIAARPGLASRHRRQDPCGAGGGRAAGSGTAGVDRCGHDGRRVRRRPRLPGLAVRGAARGRGRMTGPATALPVDPRAFDAALAGAGATLLDSDGGAAGLPVRRWSGPADADDAWLLDRCTGPTVDLGCGPGRLLVALARRGVPALGIDHSLVAQAQCRARGVVMLRRDVFARVPGEGRWAHVLLADGNIGIGGDPQRLLVRAAGLLAVGGTVLVETDPEPGKTGEEWFGCTLRAGPGLRRPGRGWAPRHCVASRRRWASPWSRNGPARGPSSRCAGEDEGRVRMRWPPA